MIELEVWSDLVCPWCYVGKRRLEAALAEYEHAGDVVVTWRSFELDPSAPPRREYDNTEHLVRKYGRSRDEILAMQEQMRQTAAADGIVMRHDIARGGNTFDAHRLTHLAREHGLQDAVVERLMRGFHTEGRVLGDHDTLAELAVEAGLPEGEVGAVLASDRFADAVRADERAAAELGARGVPFFVADRAVAASGAQPPEVLRALLDRARPAAA